MQIITISSPYAKVTISFSVIIANSPLKGSYVIVNSIRMILFEK